MKAIATQKEAFEKAGTPVDEDNEKPEVPVLEKVVSNLIQETVNIGAYAQSITI